MVRGLPMEPKPPIAERVRALPFFINNLTPVPRQLWIKLARRSNVAIRMGNEPARLGPMDTLPKILSGTLPRAVVLDSAGILLGAVEHDATSKAMEAMNPAPQTIRPDMTHQLAASLLEHNRYLLITDADGRYLGLYHPF